MGSQNLDFEIVYAIKSGHHSFSKIWDNVKPCSGSKKTFSEHLPQLVKSSVLKKVIENKKSQYYLNDYVEFEKSKDNFIQAKKEIENIKKMGKKLSDKKLLQIFMNDTIANLIMRSSFHFGLLMSHNKTLENLNKNKILKNLNKNRLEILDKLIETRIDILLKRDEDLLIVFFDLVDDNLTNMIDVRNK